jgi:hypothetical protein
MKLIRKILLGFMLVAVVWTTTLTPVSAEGPLLRESSTCVLVKDKEISHNVHGIFLVFYLTHDGVDNFGVPLTEAFWDGAFIVQYFERARLEFHPENPEPYRVLLGLLGLEEYSSTSPTMDPPIRVAAIPPADNPNFLYFPATGHMISFAIKDYFESHGGVDVFGYPISQLRYESGNFVQYFQRQRLEWNPADIGTKVRPTAIGKTVLDKKYPATFQWRASAVNDWCPETTLDMLKSKSFPAPTPATVSAPSLVPPTSLQLRVTVQFKQTGPTGPQYVDVLVTEPSGKPVDGAALYAVVYFQNGKRYFPLLASDSVGKSTLQFDIGKQPIGSSTSIEVVAIVGAVNGAGNAVFTR